MTPKDEKLLTDFYNYLKEQCPTYRIGHMNTDLLVQSFILNRKASVRPKQLGKWQIQNGKSKLK